MDGLVSLLPQPQYDQVHQIWQNLQEKFGLRGIYVTPYPHFSWQIASQYPEDQVESAMNELAHNLKPFTVHTTGLGVFTGGEPVIFIPVVKDAQLVNIHRTIWEKISPIGVQTNPLYNPDHWVPHITIAHQDVTPENIGGVMQLLAFQSFNWEIRVDNLTLIQEPDGCVGEIKYKINLGVSY
jgi:2'-5' RNA ligase